MSRKRKKEDRAKVQLKKPKTAPGKFLPKGTNETKPELKIRKIVIPGQQQSSSGSAEHGPITSKKLGLNDVLNKLGHFSQAVRTDGLEGLKELLSGSEARGLVLCNLTKLVTMLVNLVQDREKKIRQLAVTCLGLSLGQAAPGAVTPLYPLISAHLSCCLTNISPRIQQDGLTLLDTILDKTPSFIKTHYQDIIPNCLDQITNKKSGDGKGPSVAANLSEVMTALQWRMSVLTRVDRILETARSGHLDSVVNNVQTSSFDYDPDKFYPLPSTQQSSFSITNLANQEHSSNILNICLLVMPLLIETWVEARASDARSSKSSVLSNESCSLLHKIAGIMDKLLVILKKSESLDDRDDVKTLKDKFSQDLQLHFLKYLPYSSSNTDVSSCNVLLSCVAEHLGSSDDWRPVAVNMCSNKHVSDSLKLRVTDILLSSSGLSEDLRNNVVKSLISMVEDSSNVETKEKAIQLIRAEVIKNTKLEASLMWIDRLPELLCQDVEDEFRLQLLETSLSLVQCRVEPLAVKMRDCVDDIEKNAGDCVRSCKLVNFIKFYCNLIS